MDYQLAIRILLLGPLVGTAAVLPFAHAKMQLWVEPDAVVTIFRATLLIVPAGWCAGALPAAVAAIAWIGVERLITPAWLRLLVAAIIGATAGATLIWPLLTYALGRYADGWFTGPAAFSGAIALSVTARPWRV